MPQLKGILHMLGLGFKFKKFFSFQNMPQFQVANFNYQEVNLLIHWFKTNKCCFFNHWKLKVL